MELRGERGGMKQPSLRIIPHQPLRNAAGFAGVLALDADEENRVDKLGRWLRRKQSDMRANGGTGANGRGKTNLIQAIVDAHRDARANLDCLLHEVTNQRKREKAVCNGGTERRFAFSALRVQVNPLAVFGGVSKFLDAILGDDEPIGRGEFAAFELFQRI